MTDDPRVADLRCARRLRFGLFPSFFYSKAANGELHGVGVEIARALAANIGVTLELREYPNPPGLVQALAAGEIDVATLGLDPARAAQVDFTPPYMKADFSFVVPQASSVQKIADADQTGIRIAIVRGHAMDTVLKTKHAERIYADVPDAAFELLRANRADVLAGIRPGLVGYAAKLPGSRVLSDSYGANILALAVAKGQGARLAFVSEFIVEARTSGLVQRAIDQAGLRGIDVIAS
ncbi:MAG: transporter substrate-binding domain-containing protein [Xanthobacteraceae bacterium]